MLRDVRAACLAALALPAIVSAQVWVSPSGSDNNDGSQNSPVFSMSKAQGLMRNILHSGNPLTSDLYCYMEPGTYYIDETLIFTNWDNGIDGHNVIYTASQMGEGGTSEVNWSGGTPITGWTVYDSNNNIWSAPVPAGSRSRHFFVNQKNAVRSSYGLSRSALTLQEQGFTLNTQSDQFLASLPGIAGPGKAELRSRGSWTDRYMGVESVGNIGGDPYLQIYNPAFNNNIIGYDTFINPSYTYGALWIENMLGILTDVNEYYLDTDNDVIYYKPDNGVDMNQQYAVLPRLEVLLTVSGYNYDGPASNIIFQGINYMHTTWNQPSTNLGFVDQQTGGYLGMNRTLPEWIGGFPFWSTMPGSIQASAVNNVKFLNGSLVAIGNGIGIGNDPNACSYPGPGLGASNVTVAGMTFSQTGGQPLTVGGMMASSSHPAADNQVNRNILITENIFFDLAYTQSGSAPIVSTYVDGAVITNNDISNIPYSGIVSGWGWGSNDAGGNPVYTQRGLYNYQQVYQTPTILQNNLVSGNLISNIGTLHTDLGAIYTLSASPGTQINQNCVNSGQWSAIYHDEGSRFYTDSDQVFFSNYWLSRNEGGGQTTGNITAYNMWVTSNTDSGTNQYGDNIYNMTQFNDQSQLPSDFRAICCNAGIPPAQRNGRPTSGAPVSGC